MQTRQHFLKIERQHLQLQELREKLNQSLRVVTKTQQTIKVKDRDQLPTVIPEGMKIKADRIQSERLRYQKNLHTIIFQIKQKMSASDVAELKLSGRQSNRRHALGRHLLKDKNIFKIQTLSLSPIKNKTNEISKSYVDRRVRRFSPHKSSQDGGTFYFEPWNTF